MERQKTLDDLYSALVDDLDAIIERKVRDILAEILPGVDNAMLLDIPEAAIRMRVSRTTVRRMIAADNLKSVRIGRRLLVPVTAIDAYLNGSES